MKHVQMHAVREHRVPFQQYMLAADSYDGDSHGAHVLALHGGGASQRSVFVEMRQQLRQRGTGSTALDCVGHGQTGGMWADSSLCLRDQQALAVMAHVGVQPTVVIGSSMGAYNAIQLSRHWALDALVLLVPGIYTPQAYALPFGPAFSQVIRQFGSWRSSDAWELLAAFRGRLLVVAAECDTVIPAEIPQRLYASATLARERELLWVPQAGHQGILARLLAEPAWRARLLDMLSTVSN